MRRGRHRGRGMLLVWAVWWCALVSDVWAGQKPCPPPTDGAQTGTIRGIVRDPALRPIAAAEVIAEGSVIICSAITNSEGAYQIDRLPPGSYKVRVERRGFKSDEPALDVKAKSEQVRDFNLEDRPPARQARFWGGLNAYAMDNFNQLLAFDLNEPISWGFSAGAEVSVAATNVKFVQGALQLPIGIEYLAATSTTTHSGAGGSATVIWDLPVVGLFVAPTLSVGSAERFYIHPAVGYYFLGVFQEAGLSVTDRSGRLAAKDAAPGVFAAIGLNQRMGDRAGLFAEGGYRYLKFTSVEMTPRGDFPAVLGGAAVSGGTLAAPVDYSGFVVRLGFTLRLSGGQ